MKNEKNNHPPLILSISMVLLYLINTYIFKDILFTNPISEWIISYITDVINSLISILSDISNKLNNLPDNQEIVNPHDFNKFNNSNNLNKKHLVTATVISVMLFMIIWDIYNLTDNSFLDELYSNYQFLEEEIKVNCMIKNEIETILKTR